LEEEFIMDSGRLFRAVLTGIVLIGCIWGLRQLEARRTRPILRPARVGQTEVATPAQDQNSTEPLVEVVSLPFVALDNTCYYSGGEDLSHCTGSLSGAPAREYRLSATKREALWVGVQPRSDYFDPSFALLTADQRCIAGYDNQGPGLPETAMLNDLEPGEYLLVVGGYGEDCGPYELTVRQETPEIARVVETRTIEGPNGTVVRWGTFAEVDLDYFILYRTVGEDRQQIAVLRAHGSPAGFARYRVMDRKPQPDSTYEIEAVASDGRIELIDVTT
jgi:hypothetical protein